MNQPRRADAGLSLIEVMVSLAIFAVIGIAGLSMLNTVARTGERTEGRLERLTEMDRAFLILGHDLAQITPAGMKLDTGTLAFQRAGADRALDMEILMQDDAMVRRIDMPTTASVDQIILANIDRLEWRLMAPTKRWHADWPPPGISNPGRPLAAELSLDLRRDGIDKPQRVTRLFVLPAGQGR